MTASFIGETHSQTVSELTMEELAELGWNIYSLKEKNMKMKLHFDFLKTCREENFVPTINKLSAVGEEDEHSKTSGMYFERVFIETYGMPSRTLRKGRSRIMVRK